MDRISRCLFFDGHDHIDCISVVIFYMDQGVRGTLFEATSHTHPEWDEGFYYVERQQHFLRSGDVLHVLIAYFIIFVATKKFKTAALNV